MKNKRGYILSSFRDAGTGESFEPSADPALIDAGQFGNYEAAGLVSADPPEGARKASPTSPARSRTAKSRPRTAKTKAPAGAATPASPDTSPAPQDG